MNLELKRRLTAFFILAFALWPAVHYGLVLRFDVDPWKLFGWAMYSVPGSMKTVRLAALTDKSMVVIEPGSYSERERRAVTRYTEWQRGVGRLAGPEPLLEAFFEERPQLGALVVALATLKLDRESARLAASLDYTRFNRDGSFVVIDPALFGHEAEPPGQ